MTTEQGGTGRRDPDDAAPGAGPSPAGLLGRAWVGALVLAALYAVLTLVVDPGGSLGTDTGAKVATLEQMVEHDTFRPDVGYWAQDSDPIGAYHPLVFTTPNDRGEWINVTTLPMLVAARPLYAWGGYRLALALPILGAVAAALACRALARRLGDADGDGDRAAGVRAFWIAGLAGPLAVYALDLWEHTIGAGLMLWAVVALVDASPEPWGQGRPTWWRPLVAGLLLGAAASMRTETFVIAFVVTGAVCLATLATGARLAAVRTGALTVVGFAAMWLANGVLERTLGGQDRAGRTADIAGQAASSQLGTRLDEAAVTWFGLPGLGHPLGALTGVIVVGLVAYAIVGARHGRRHASQIAIGGAVTLVVLTLVGAGLSFVSGALVASPVAVVAFTAPRLSRRQVLVVGTALASTVCIWATQYVGGAGPQWGGRYILVPTLLLTVFGAVRLGTVTPGLARIVVGLGVAVTVFGVAWLSHRSHRIDEFFDTLEARPEDVVIATNGFLVREAADDADARRYLSLSPGHDLAGAVAVVRDEGLDTFAVLTEDSGIPDVAARLTSSDTVTLLGVGFHLYSYSVEAR